MVRKGLKTQRDGKARGSKLYEASVTVGFYHPRVVREPRSVMTYLILSLA